MNPTSILGAAAASTTDTLFTVFVVFVAAKVMAEVFERLRQPAVVGEILAGVLIGPYALRLITPNEPLTALAEMGIILLLFNVGLEVRPSQIFSVGRRAVIVAVGGVVLPFVAGLALAWLWHRTSAETVFLGAAMVATSVGITARVLAGLGLLQLETSRIILGAAVIDDILGLMILSVVSSLAGGTVNLTEIGITTAMSVAFTTFIVLVGARLAHRARPAVERLRHGDGYFFSGLGLCLGLSFLAIEFGVAPIIGAFLAGMALSDIAEDTELPQKVNSVTEFLVPFFLVSIGMQLDLTVFRSPGVVAFAVVVTLVAVATKLVGCGAGAWTLGRRPALQIGMGMVPRGEVGIIVAQVGLALQVLTAELYAVVVFMAVATTLVAPPFLARLYAGEESAVGTDDV